MNPLLLRDTTLSLRQIDSLDTGRNIAYLNDKERDIIFLVNYIRCFGSRFIKVYFNEYWNRYRGYEPEKSDLKHIIRLLNDLEMVDKNPCPILLPDSGLCAAAKFHAQDLGDSGEFGPFSSDSSTPGERLKRFGHTGKMAENYAVGNAPLDMVVLWLIDEEGAPKYKKRLNLLNPSFIYTGVGFHNHLRFKYCGVQNFDSDKF